MLGLICVTEEDRVKKIGGLTCPKISASSSPNWGIMTEWEGWMLTLKFTHRCIDALKWNFILQSMDLPQQRLQARKTSLMSCRIPSRFLVST